MERFSGKQLKFLCSDKDGEYVFNEFEDYLMSHAMSVQLPNHSSNMVQLNE